MFEFELHDWLNSMHVNLRKQDIKGKMKQQRKSIIDRSNHVRMLEELGCIPTQQPATEEWFKQLNDLAMNVQTPLSISEEVLLKLDFAVRNSRSLQAIEAYKRVIALLCNESVEILVRGGLIGFLYEILEQGGQLEVKENAILIAATLAIKDIQWRDMVVVNDVFRLAMRVAGDNPNHLSKSETLMFVSVLSEPCTVMSHQEIKQTLDFHLGMLQQRRGNMCDILNGFQALANWRAPWLLHLLFERNIVQTLLSMTSELQLKPDEIKAVHQVIYILTELQDEVPSDVIQYFQRVRPETTMLLSFLLGVLNEQSEQFDDNRSRVYFELSNIFCSASFEVLEVLMRMNIMKKLAKSVKRQRKLVLLEGLLAIRNLINSLNMQEMEREFVDSGLLDTILYEVELHLIHSEDVLMVLLQIVNSLTQSHSIMRIIDSRMVLRSLLKSESREKLKSFWEWIHNSNEDRHSY